MRAVLVVEDSPEMRLLVEASLQDYSLTFATTLSAARQALRREKFALMLLDLGLPDGDGLQFLAEFSGDPNHSQLPVMILSGKAEVSNKVLAFSIGAEDFITKPFDPLELRARVAARLKKMDRRREDSEVLRVGDLLLDVPKQRVSIQAAGGAEFADLTSLEFRLLHLLARFPDRVFSRDYLLNEVWGTAVNVNDRTVDAHIGHLRKKLGESRVKIDTVVGSGYRLRDHSA